MKDETSSLGGCVHSLVRIICCLVLVAGVSGCSATSDRLEEVEFVIDGAGLENLPGLIDSYSYGAANAISGDPPTTALVYESTETLSMEVENALLDYGFQERGVNFYGMDAADQRSSQVTIGKKIMGPTFDVGDDLSIPLPSSGGLVVKVSNR